MRLLLGFLALLTLAACLALPVMHFQGRIDNTAYKQYLLVASVAWFVLAIPWMTTGKPK
jgi:hypothetical protein